MAVHIIIDGYNLIRQSAELSLLDRRDLQQGREALLELLAAYKKIKRHQITVVFDGTDAYSLYRQRDQTKGIKILFSRRGETADTVIKRMVEREREGALVVSSDRDVAGFRRVSKSGHCEFTGFHGKIDHGRLVQGKRHKPRS